jgi:hypothetical protein
LAIVLQTAELAESCFLSELLTWLALHRLPLANYALDGDEFRFSREMELFVHNTIAGRVTESECALAGLPLSPQIEAWNEDTHLSSVDFYNKILESDFYDDDQRRKFEDERKQAIELAEKDAAWQIQYLEYLEYYKAKIFVDMRDGKIKGRGIKLLGSNEEEIGKSADKIESRLNEIQMTPIPPEAWVASRIDWNNCILYNDENAYCWVNFDVNEMLSLYEIRDRPSAGAIIQVGNLFVLEQAVGAEASVSAPRGRPALPWDQFHLEVAALIDARALPQKKESAIQHFENWFRVELGLQVGRSSIGQKLTPYYDRFVWGSGNKSE